MRRYLLRWWPGMCLLVPLLTCGCQHNRASCSTCNTPTAMGAPVAAPISTAPAVGAPSQSGVPGLPAANTAQPVVHTVAKAGLASAGDPMLSQAPPGQPSVASPYASTQSVTRLSLPESVPDGQVPSGPRFAHDPNYHWMVGTLDYSRIQQAWLLRYVPFEEDDRYGGCVTLVTPSRITDFKPGQVVRVEGALIDPESQQLRPAFEVKNIRAD